MRRFSLLMLSLVLIIVFYQIDQYQDWIDHRIINYAGGSIGEDINNLDVEERRKIRFGPLYSFCEQMKTVIKRDYPATKKEPPMILMPPQEYVQLVAPGFTIPEPLIFYYMTGVHSTYPGGAEMYKANCALLADKTMIIMMNSKADIDSMVKQYNQLIQKASKK